MSIEAKPKPQYHKPHPDSFKNQQSVDVDEHKAICTGCHAPISRLYLYDDDRGWYATTWTNPEGKKECCS
jgi:hypothetical protein